MPNIICSGCSGRKDHRAKFCNTCRFKFNHPRKGTGKGWRIHNTTGYIAAFIEGKWTLQHRYIMEQHLGRKLESWENVHHINHDKIDNRLENLEIMTASEHHRLHIEDNKYEMSNLGHKTRWNYAPHF